MSQVRIASVTTLQAKPLLGLEVLIPLGLLSAAIGFPVLLLLSSAFNVGDPQAIPAREFGLGNVPALFDSLHWIGNSLIVALGVTVLALAIAIPLSWILNRTTMPGRSVFQVLFAIPYPLGPLVGALAWHVLGSPRSGLINDLYSYLTGVDAAIINTSTVWGIIFVEAVFEAPVAILMIGAAMQRMDPSLEEASSIFGSGRARTAFKVTLPLMLPAILSAALFLFASAMGAFAIPAILGAGARFYTATTAIYVLFQGYPPNYPLAALLGIVLIALTALAVWLSQRILRGRSYVVVTGRSYRPRLIDMGRLTWVLFGFCSLYVFVSLILPLGALILASVQISSDIRLSSEFWTLRNFNYVLFEFTTTHDAFINSIILGICTGVIGAVLATILSWIVHRSKSAGRGLLEQVIMVPQAFPRVIFGVGLLWMVLAFPLNLYGTIWAVLFAYLIVFLPLGFRSMSGVMVQIEPALEEAARVSGANWRRVAWTVTAPLLRGGMVSTAMLLFMVSIREVSASLFLIGPNSPVLGPAILNFWDSGGLPLVSALAVSQAAVILPLFLLVRR